MAHSIFQFNLLRKTSRLTTTGLLFAVALLFPNATVSAAVSNGISTDPNFFPLAVFDQSPESTAQAYKNIGINTFIELPNGTTTSAISAVSNQGMYLMSGQNSAGLAANSNTMRGWVHPDEPDAAGTAASSSTVTKNYSSMKSTDPLRRPIYVNFTGGVVSSGKRSTYEPYIAGADIVSYDVYPVNNGLPLSYAAQGVDNLRSWTGGQKPVFEWIETTDISSNGKGPTPKQTKAEVWMAINHGATGIGYYCHILKPTKIDAGLLKSSTMSSAVSAINSQITSLAPVLNSDTITNGAQVTPSGQVDTMTKQYGGATYVFAVGTSDKTTTATIKTAGQTAGTVSVVGENRTLNSTNGAFSDTFNGYDVHIYKITSGQSEQQPTQQYNPSEDSSSDYYDPYGYDGTTNPSLLHSYPDAPDSSYSQTGETGY